MAGLAVEPKALSLAPAGVGVGGEQDVAGWCEGQDVIDVDGDPNKGVP